MGRKKGSSNPGKPRSNTRKTKKLKSIQEATEKRKYASSAHEEKEQAEVSDEETKPITKPGFSREAETVNTQSLPKDRKSQRDFLRGIRGLAPTQA